MTEAPGKKSRFPLYLQILAAMALGMVLGPLLGKDAAPLGELGKVVISLIKAVATPLLFFAIINAILKSDLRSKSAGRMLFVAFFNAGVALLIGLLISNLLQPGKHLSAVAAASVPGDAAKYAGKKIDFLATFVGYIPTSVAGPFVENMILGVIALGLLFGFGIRVARTEQQAAGQNAYLAIENGVETLLRVTELSLGWVIKLIPFAVFGVVTKAVGEHGFAPLRGLGVYVLVGLLGLILHILIVHQAWIAFFVKMPLRKFWREAKEPVFYAMGANSSLATLPVTLRALDRLGVSRGASALGACVGTNFNNDGIILYEGMAMLFVAQASGIELSLGQQVFAALACMVAAMGVAGIPEAGFISLAIVLTTVGLPVDILPLLLTVDWIIARGRSVANVLSDMVLSLTIDAGLRPEERIPPDR